jgi:hypothetical protein
MRRTIVLAVVAAAALALGVGQAPALSSPTAVEDLAGHWQGFFQSSHPPVQIGNFVLDTTIERNRQLDGTLSSPTLPMSLPFHVTVGASGVFTAVSPGGNFVVHGMLDADFSFFAHGDYRLRQGGMTDIGTLDFFKSFPAEGAVQLPSALEGPFVRDDGQTGRILVGIHFQSGSDFGGVAMFGDVPFPFLGSIGAADDHGMAPVRALSVSPAGTILITGVWDTAPLGMNGMARVTLGDGSVRFINYGLSPAAGG